MRTSYSALQTFKQCPQKYKFQEIDKIKVLKSKEAVFGTLVHSALQYMFSKDPLFPTLDEIINHFREGWLAKNIKLPKDEDELYQKQGEGIIKRFYAKNPPWNFHVVDLESRFEVVVEDPETKETHILAGIMDRIDKPDETTYEIIDYKTTRKMQSQASLDQDLQLSLYHLGLVRRWPHLESNTISLSLYYLKHSEKITTTRSPEDLDRIKRVVLETIHEIEERQKTGEFPPQPSALCDWCGYKPICPAWKYLYEKKEVEIKNKEDIEKVIQEFFDLRKQDKEISKRMAELQADIKAYMDQEKLTRVFGAEGIIAKKLMERYTYDFEKIKEILSSQNRLDIWDTLFSPDAGKLKKILKEIPPNLREKIEEAKNLAKSYEMLSVSSKKTEGPEDDSEASDVVQD